MRCRQALGGQRFAIRGQAAQGWHSHHLGKAGFRERVILLRIGPYAAHPIGITHHVTRRGLRAARNRQQCGGQKAPARHATLSDNSPTESP